MTGGADTVGTRRISFLDKGATMSKSTRPKGVSNKKRPAKGGSGGNDEVINPKLGPGVMLINANYDYADLSGVNLDGATIIGGSFRGTNFTGANLSGVHCVSLHRETFPDFSGAIFDGASMSWMVAPECSFAKASMVRAQMGRIKLFKANLEGADLQYADLREAELRETNLLRVNCSGASFKQARIRSCDAREVVGLRASFAQARINDTKLTGSNFKGSNFASASICQCELGEANFSEILGRGAMFDMNKGASRAKWKNADLYWSTWTEQKVKTPEVAPGWELNPVGEARLDAACIRRRARALGLDGELAVTIHTDQVALDFNEVIKIAKAMSRAVGTKVE